MERFWLLDIKVMGGQLNVCFLGNYKVEDEF